MHVEYTSKNDCSSIEWMNILQVAMAHFLLLTI